MVSHTRPGIDQRSLDEYYGINAHQTVRIVARQNHRNSLGGVKMAQDKVGGLLGKFKEGAEKAKKAAGGVVGDERAAQDRVGELLTGFKERAGEAKAAATEMVSDDKLAELIVNVTHKVKRINTILEKEESEFIIASFELTVGLGIPEITLAIGRR